MPRKEYTGYINLEREQFEKLNAIRKRWNKTWFEFVEEILKLLQEQEQYGVLWF